VALAVPASLRSPGLAQAELAARRDSAMADDYVQRAKHALWYAWKARGLEHAVRTALAAAASLALAHLFAMPESYWAPITTLIVMQSTLGAAWEISKQRLIGTALGAAMGTLMVSYFDRGVVAFGLAILALGVVCGITRLDRTAYKFAGITLAIVMLIVRANAIWITAIHRFAEVSLGIAVGLVFAALWPRRELRDGKK
jgi:uncharacterized membrane protein YccC